MLVENKARLSIILHGMNWILFMISILESLVSIQCQILEVIKFVHLASTLNYKIHSSSLQFIESRCIPLSFVVFSQENGMAQNFVWGKISKTSQRFTENSY